MYIMLYSFRLLHRREKYSQKSDKYSQIIQVASDKQKYFYNPQKIETNIAPRPVRNNVCIFVICYAPMA